MRLGRLGALASSELIQPCIRFFGSHMKAGSLIFLPCSESVILEKLPRFLTVDILLYCLTHQPMRRTLARRCEALQAIFHFLLKLQAGRRQSGHLVPPGVTL